MQYHQAEKNRRPFELDGGFFVSDGAYTVSTFKE
jgi:hypothetical protein